MINKNEIQSILDTRTQVVSNDGEKIGNVGQVYLDDVTGEPTWVTVKTGLFGGSESFVPVDDAVYEGDDLRVPYTKDTIKDAPRVDADQNISPAEEDELYRYYGQQQGRDQYETSYERDRAAGVGTAGAAGTAGVAGAAGNRDRDTAYDVDATKARGDVDRDRTAERRTGDDGVTLHEEDVNIGTRRTDGGTVRLRKYTVTENVTKTVPVTREEVRVERVPAGQGDVASDGTAFSDRDGEVVGEVHLNNEEVVVDRDVRATEHVSLGKDTVTEQREVNEQVRHEEVEIEREGDRRDGTDVNRDKRI